MVFFNFTACEIDKSQLQATPSFEISPETELQHIASGQNIRNIWWSPDSKTVYWQWGVYNLDNKTTRDLSEEDILLQTPQPMILDQLPPYYRAYPSPSGNRALYFSATDAPILPTFDPAIEGGETPAACGTSELHMWTINETVSLGYLEHCGPNNYLWTSDEQKVVLIQNEMLPSTWRAWLIDIPRKIIHPIESSEFGLLQIHSISPDDQYLLYSYYLDNTGEDKLFLLDLESLVSFPLETIVHSVGDWLSPQAILVWCYGGELDANHPLGILDLTTLQCTNLPEKFSNLVVGYVDVSPDKQWIAFTTGETIHTQDNVWLMELNIAEYDSTAEGADS